MVMDIAFFTNSLIALVMLIVKLKLEIIKTNHHHISFLYCLSDGKFSVLETTPMHAYLFYQSREQNLMSVDLSSLCKATTLI